MPPPIEHVLQRHTPRLMAIEGVVGVAQGELPDAPCITVLLATLSKDLTSQIPRQLDGYPVTTMRSGDLNAL